MKFLLDLSRYSSKAAGLGARSEGHEDCGRRHQAEGGERTGCKQKLRGPPSVEDKRQPHAPCTPRLQQPQPPSHPTAMTGMPGYPNSRTVQI